MSTVLHVDLPLTLTVEEAAGLLGIGRAAGYEGVRTGEIPSLRIGRRILIPTARLLEMLGIEVDGTDSDRSPPGMGAGAAGEATPAAPKETEVSVSNSIVEAGAPRIPEEPG